MTLMIGVSVGSAVAADRAKFDASSLLLLGVCGVGYVLWNLIGTRGLVALVLWEGNAPPPVEDRVPRGGIWLYFSVQIALAGLVY